MNVYVVSFATNHEGSCVSGVFDSLNKAKKYAKEDWDQYDKPRKFVWTRIAPSMWTFYVSTIDYWVIERMRVQ